MPESPWLGHIGSVCRRLVDNAANTDNAGTSSSWEMLSSIMS